MIKIGLPCQLEELNRVRPSLLGPGQATELTEIWARHDKGWLVELRQSKNRMRTRSTRKEAQWGCRCPLPGTAIIVVETNRGGDREDVGGG